MQETVTSKTPSKATMKKIKAYFTSRYEVFCSRTNMHGFGELYVSQSCFGKIFWIVSLALCLGLTTYQLSEAIDEYVNEPYITVIEKIKDHEIVYPDLSVCYLHWMYWVDFEKASQIGFNFHATLYGLSYLTDIFTEEYFVEEKIKSEFLSSMTKNNFSRVSEFFNGIAKDPPNDHFTEIYFRRDILCYRTNGLKLINQEKRGRKIKTKQEKLKVEFKLNDNTISDKLSQEDSNCYSAYFLQEDEMYNDFDLKEEQFLNSFVNKNYSKTNTMTQLPTFFYVDNDLMEIRWDDLYISVHSHAGVGKWKNTSALNCIPDQVSVTSNTSCNSKCYGRFIHQTCPCTFFLEVSGSRLDYVETLCRHTIYFTSSANTCASVIMEDELRLNRYSRNVNATMLNCTIDPFFECCEETDNSTYEMELEDCKKSCTPGCTIWNYYLGYVQRLKLGHLREVLSKDHVNVEIIFPTTDEVLATNEIDHQSFEKFVGNIGGLLGVWTGASILSMLQLMYLCCCGEFRCCPKKGGLKQDSTRMTEMQTTEYVVEAPQES